MASKSDSPAVDPHETDRDTINFFRLCLLVVRDIPKILRHILRGKKWSTSGKELFQSRLNPKQVKLLTSGDTEKWDTTLLRHALLYSSQFLLAEFCEAVQYEGSDAFFIGFSFYGSPCDILLHLPYIKDDLIRKRVSYVEEGSLLHIDFKGDEFHSKAYKYYVDPKRLPNIRTEANVYICTEEWLLIESLTDIRNKYFAHCESASIESTKLNEIVKEVKELCHNLVGNTEMLTPLSEPIGDSFWARRLAEMKEESAKMRDMWLKEKEAYYEYLERVDQRVSDLSEQVADLKLKDEEKSRVIAEHGKQLCDVEQKQKFTDEELVLVREQLEQKNEERSAGEQLMLAGEQFKLGGELLQNVGKQLSLGRLEQKNEERCGGGIPLASSIKPPSQSMTDNQSKEQDSGLDMDDGDELSVPKPKKEEMVVTPSSYSQPQQVQSNDHEIQELHERVESYKSLAEQFEKDNEKLQREAKEKEEHCVKLNDTLVETKSKLAEIRSEFAAKEKENESLKIKLATYKENMEKLQKKLEETKKAEIEEKDRIIEGLKKEIQHHQEKIMELKKELEEQKENLGRLKNLFVQEFAKHEDKNMKIEEKINKLTIGYQT